MFCSKIALHVSIFCGIFFTVTQNVYGTLPTTTTTTTTTTTESENLGQGIYKIENIDLNTIHENKGIMIRYQYVVIAFWSAMNDALEKRKLLRRPIPSSILQLSVSNPTQFNKEIHDEILKQAIAAVKTYKDAFNDDDLILSDYAPKAHYCRLLMWLKYNMRHETKQNAALEGEIKEKLSRKDLYLHRTVMQNILTLNKIKEECNATQTFEELTVLGDEEDKIIEFCFKIASTKGSPSDIEKYIGSLNDNVKLYEDFLEKAEDNYKYGFISLTEQNALQVLTYIYEAQGIKRNTYHPIELETLRVDLRDGPYITLRNAVILFCKVIEKKLLLGKSDYVRTSDVLRLENFHPDEKFTTMKNKAFTWLINKIIDNDYDRIIQEFERKGEWADPSKFCYRDMMKWLLQHVLSIGPSKLGNSYMNIEKKIYKILESTRTEGANGANFKLNENDECKGTPTAEWLGVHSTYLNIVEWEGLLEMCSKYFPKPKVEDLLQNDINENE